MQIAGLFLFSQKIITVGRSQKKPHLKNVEIIDVAAEGKALGKVEEKVVFAAFAVPGDVVDIQVTKKRKKFMEGHITAYHNYSDIRVSPECEHFGTCGGCKWQMLPYEQQLKYKQQHVTDALVRLGKIALPEIEPILGSSETYYYRNKMEYAFCNNRWILADEIESEEELDRRAGGFNIPGRFDRVLDVKTCHLQAEPSNAIRNELKAFAIENNIPFANLRTNEGTLRSVYIRTASTGEIMAIVVFWNHETEKMVQVMEFMKQRFPEITSLYLATNQHGNTVLDKSDLKLYNGKPIIEEEMEGLRFKISPRSFYQTNSKQAYTLYKKAREFAGLTGNETVYDLYTGTGTIACFIAKQAKKVVGIEYVEDAIADAKENAIRNELSNTAFFAGDMKDILTTDFISKHGQPDVIITDPPRAGMHEDVIKTIISSNTSRIVYVSCNPGTQARDLSILDEHYRVARVQAVDMFPQTAHIENIVLLEKR